METKAPAPTTKTAESGPRHAQAALPLAEPPKPAMRRPARLDETIASEAALRAFLARAAANCGFIAINTEPDGLIATRSIVLPYSPVVASGCAGTRHCGTRVLAAGPRPRPSMRWGPVLTDRNTLKIYQDAKFDMLADELWFFGAVVFDDAMLISYSAGGRYAWPWGWRNYRSCIGHTPVTYDEITGTGRARLPSAGATGPA